MINEEQAVELIVGKIWQAIRRDASTHHETLIPYAHVYEAMGRRGFRKSEVRLLGHFFESKGFLDIAKHGWLIKPLNISQ